MHLCVLLAVVILSWLRQTSRVAKTPQGPDCAMEEQLMEFCATGCGQCLSLLPPPQQVSTPMLSGGDLNHSMGQPYSVCVDRCFI